MHSGDMLFSRQSFNRRKGIISSRAYVIFKLVILKYVLKDPVLSIMHCALQKSRPFS